VSAKDIKMRRHKSEKNNRILFASVMLLATGMATPVLADGHGGPQQVPKILTKITGVGQFARSITISEKLNKIYVHSPFTGYATIIDGRTSQITKTLQISPNTWYSSIDDAHNQFLPLGDSESTLFTFDTRTDQLLGSIGPIGTQATPAGCDDVIIKCTNNGSDTYSVTANSRTQKAYVGRLKDDLLAEVDTCRSYLADKVFNLINTAGW
jgi:hypothetical protein